VSLSLPPFLSLSFPISDFNASLRQRARGWRDDRGNSARLDVADRSEGIGVPDGRECSPPRQSVPFARERERTRGLERIAYYSGDSSRIRFVWKYSGLPINNRRDLQFKSDRDDCADRESWSRPMRDRWLSRPRSSQPPVGIICDNTTFFRRERGRGEDRKRPHGAAPRLLLPALRMRRLVSHRMKRSMEETPTFHYRWYNTSWGIWIRKKKPITTDFSHLAVWDEIVNRVTVGD